MAERGLVCVLTTIQEPTPCVRHLAETLRDARAEFIVVGDRKGPTRFDLPGCRFLSLDDQLRLPFRLARLLPTGHYARKNLGYLSAVRDGAECIYETDDDNRPNVNWRPRAVLTRAQAVAPRPWMNVYRAFTDTPIWPRGFPLDRINDPATCQHDADAPTEPVVAPIQQGLADLAPDVDAVWRLVYGQDVAFRPGASLWLPPGTWCPFNSQSTWWWPAAFPLLYLPSHCSFRMTDIWRSFVAQRCLWALGHGVVFHASEVIQERNTHDLLRDFKDETSGYLGNQRLVDCLDAVELASGSEHVTENLKRCYGALMAANFFPRDEEPLVAAWITDMNMVRQRWLIPGLAA